MKALLDYDGLKRVAAMILEKSHGELIPEIEQKPDAVEIWVTTESVTGICRYYESDFSRNDLKGLVEIISRQCTVIAGRRETLVEALQTGVGKLDHGLNIQTALFYKLDCILTERPGCYEGGPVPAVTLNELPLYIEDYNATPVRSVPFLDLKAQLPKIYTEIDERITRIIADTRYILGPNVEEFEARFQTLQETRFCLGVSNGTAALHLALMAVGIGPGDLVLLPVNTFIATAEAVSLVGALPVFVDCDEFYNIDTDKAKETIEIMIKDDSAPPKALIAVHLYGQPANMPAIMALAKTYGFMVIEDACQAHLARIDGRSVGQFGRMSAFSFYPGKNLGAFGEAGAVITDDETLYVTAKQMRQHGELERYRHEVVGHNYRMSAIQGAVLATKAKYLEEWTRRRRAIAMRYNEILAEIEEITLPVERAGTECVYHLYVIQSDRRDELRQFLAENGIDTGIHYPRALHQHRAYAHLGYRENDFPVAETAARRILSLPMYPELNERRMIYVKDKIKAFFSK